MGLVKGPAVRRKFVLIKGDNTVDTQKLQDLLAVKPERAHDLTDIAKSAKLSEDAAEAFDLVAKTLHTYRDEIKPETIAKMAEVFGVELSKAEPAPEPKPKLSPEARAELAKAEQRTAELEKQVALMKADAEHKAYLEKAAEFKAPGLDRETTAALLKAISSDAKLTEAVENHLRAASAIDSAIFKSVGKGGEGDAKTFEERVDAKAKEMVEKSEGLNYYEAYGKAYDIIRTADKQ